MVIRETVADNRNTPFEVAIFQTSDLTSKNGRIPEEMLARQLLVTFQENDRDLRIIRDHATIPIANLPSGCKKDQYDGFNAWVDYTTTNNVPLAADSNILLMDEGGGGCGGLNGNLCVAPAAHIDERRSFFHAGGDRWSRNMLGCMHEIGHNMGFRHKPHAGRGWNQNGKWHKTPTVASNGTDNLCGEFIESRQNNQVFRHLYYHDCVFDEMNIVPKELIDPPDNGGCQANADCPDGMVCENGECVEPPQGCQSDGECPDGKICVEGECVETEAPAACRSDSECPGSQICVNGECKQAPVNCTGDAECPEGSICRDGRCVEAPTTPDPGIPIGALAAGLLTMAFFLGRPDPEEGG